VLPFMGMGMSGDAGVNLKNSHTEIRSPVCCGDNLSLEHSG